jgi:hypothetical protein
MRETMNGFLVRNAEKQHGMAHVGVMCLVERQAGEKLRGERWETGAFSNPPATVSAELNGTSS